MNNEGNVEILEEESSNLDTNLNTGKSLNEVIPIYQIKKLRDKWYYVVDDY